MCEAIVTTTVMEFDLEDQLDGVMDNMEARGIMGTARGGVIGVLHAECVLETEEFVAEGRLMGEVRFSFIFGFVSLWGD